MIRQIAFRILLIGLCLVLPRAFALGATASSGTIPTHKPSAIVIINIPSRTLTLYQGGNVVATYPVGVGRASFPSPVGSFQVIRKQPNPVWENPYLPKGKMRIGAGAKNPLGTRWIGFYKDAQGEVGIHGTDTPLSVGKVVSHGCIRMRTHDAERLYEQVGLGTPIIVTYRLYDAIRSDNQLKLHWYPDPYHHGYPTARQLREALAAQYPGWQPTLDFSKALGNKSGGQWVSLGGLPVSLPSPEASTATVKPSYLPPLQPIAPLAEWMTPPLRGTMGSVSPVNPPSEVHDVSAP